MSESWECEICNRENPAFAMFCQDKTCRAVKGSWQCKSCGYLITKVEGVLLPDKIENCPNCGRSNPGIFQ
ncbi:MAG: hypothetical protein ABIA75_12625 [Candidatus Neomarinimicrobiota bacterium]